MLNELGAVDDENVLTPLGMQLARLPLDPKVGRMILEAKQRGALAEVMVIAAALSLQDVRDRPIDKQAQADQAHKKFDDERSEFLGTLRLWAWMLRARGGMNHDALLSAWVSGPKTSTPPGQTLSGKNAHLRPEQRRTKANQTATTAGAEPETHKLSNRQYEQVLRDQYINVRRAREWRDVYSQLHTVVAEHGWKLNDKPAGYEALHLSLLSGLLGNVGCKSDAEDWYLGARGIKFYAHPGANLSKKAGKWVVVAELVQTARLFGRGIAAIDPKWLEEVGAHLLKRQLLEPHWEKKSAHVVALERATLY